MSAAHTKRFKEKEENAMAINSQWQEVDRLLALAKETFPTDHGKASELAKQVVVLAQRHNYKSAEGAAFSLLGNTQKVQANFVEALEYFVLAKDCFELVLDNRNAAGAYNNIGICYSGLGNYSNTLENFHKSLAIHESLGNKTGIASLRNNIGTVYADIKDDEKALEHYYAALAINAEAGNHGLIARNNCNIGATYRNLQQFDKALEYFNKAIATHLAENDKPQLALNYGNIGVVYEEMADYPRALEFSLKALAISEEIGDKEMAAFNCTTTGNIYGDLKDFNQAFRYLQQALTNAVEIGSLRWQERAYNGLVTLYEENEMWKEALSSYKKANGLRDQLSNQEVEKKALMMDMQKKLTAEEAVRITTENILHNILPRAIAERIKNGEEEIIEHFENCSVLFTDVVGFTSWSSTMPVKELAQHLNQIFQSFDNLAAEFEVEKIKTIGDSYMCATGLPEPCKDHAERIAKMALAMNEAISGLYPNGDIVLRIGIHTGEVVAGVIGKNKYAYDLWGDTANTASRMESHGLPSKIQVSDAFRNLLMDKFQFEDRGEIDVKGKGKMHTWFLSGKKS